METPINSYEKQMYKTEVYGDKSGYGILYTGDHFVLEYSPSRDSSDCFSDLKCDLKCNGICLSIRYKKDKPFDDCSRTFVFFKLNKPLFIEKLLAPKLSELRMLPFKDRLKISIDDSVKWIKDKEQHIKAVEESANKIDQTMSEFK